MVRGPLTVDLESRKLSDVAEMSEQLLIAEVQRRLTSKYARLPPDQISTAIESAHARFDQSRIRDFVPLLVERRARAELAKAREQEPVAAAR
jgi:hypothetical protein